MKQINQKIRTFIPEDFSQVNELWSQTGMGGAHRGDNLEIIQQTIESGGKLLVMEEISTQKIIGTSWLTNDKRRIYLHHFGILPEYQDKGLSKPLMIESMKFAKETGLQVKLEVHRDNSRAINLYEKMGFKYLGDYDVYIVRDIEKNVSSPHGAMLTLLLFLFITINSLSFAQEIPFIKNDWQKAVDEAKKRNKYLFLDAYTDWCGWCKTMDKETFADKNVAEFMNANFIPLKMEMESGYGINLSMKYRISGFPTFLVFNPEGQYVYQIVGFKKPGPFLEELKKSLDKNNQSIRKGVSTKVDLEYPEFYKLSFGKGKERKMPDTATVNKFLASQADLFSEISWAVYCRFQCAPKYHFHFLENMKKYEENFGKDDVKAQLDHLLNIELQSCIKTKNKKQFDQIILIIDKYVNDDKEKTKLFYKIAYHQGMKEWEEYAKTADQLISSGGITDEGYINQYSWIIYENSDNKIAIETAIKWMKKIIEQKDYWAFFDTYAALLFKNKQYDEAEKWINEAIEKGKAENQNVKESEELLVKIIEAKKKQ